MSSSKPERDGLVIGRWVALPLAIGFVVWFAIYLRGPNRTVVDTSINSDDAVKTEWISENAVPIRSIDPEDDDFTDLMPLKNVLGNARIVMLGEATHGDGATDLAKQRLVRFLHETMGFDVLAWEESFFFLEEANRALASGQPLGVGNELIGRGTWGQYTRATLKTDRPLRHTGVDFLYGGSRASVYHERLFEFLAAHLTDLASPADLQTIDEFLRTLQGGDYVATEEKDWKLRAAVCRVQENLREKATGASNPREFDYFAKTLDGLAAHEQRLALRRLPPLPFPQNIIFRGRKMGENLIWLAREWYPAQKIIVSAASRHVARNVTTIEMPGPQPPEGAFPTESLEMIHQEFGDSVYGIEVTSPTDYREMGDLIHQELGNSVYSIAFVAYQGSRGREGQEPESVEPVAGSLESLWHGTGQRFGFLDFRSLPSDHWLRQPLVAHGSSSAIERAQWPEVFDGMFYIDTMFPDTESGEIPEGVQTRGR